ncbi:MAG: cobaltochelatase subunit CobN, partial [Smithellaceae bacterium]
MCRNSIFKSILSLISVAVIVSVLFILTGSSDAASPQTGVYLMMGDFNSRTSIEVIKNIRGRNREQSRNVHFEVITGKTSHKIRQSLAKYAKPGTASGIGVIHIMDRRLVESLKPRLMEMIKNGVKVYAVGGSYSKDDEELG